MVAEDSDYPAWSVDRPRGILSSADREFLALSPEERAAHYSRAAKGQRERAIRERARNGIVDFCLLWCGLTERDRRLIFSPHEIDNPTELRHGMTDALSLFYSEMENGKYGQTAEDRIVRFASLLRNAVWDSEAERRGVTEDFFEEIVLSVAIEFAVHVPESVNTDFIADAIDRRAIYELSQQEFEYYLFVQLQSGREVRVGRDAAAQFLEDVEHLTEDGVLKPDAFD